MDRMVHTSDGRVLAVRDAGDAASMPVLVTLLENRVSEVHWWLRQHL